MGECSSSERLEARIRRHMAELATYPATGPTAWQYRAGRKRLLQTIENTWQAYDIAREVEGSDASFFDSEKTP